MATNTLSGAKCQLAGNPANVRVIIKVIHCQGEQTSMQLAEGANDGRD